MEASNDELLTMEDVVVHLDASEVVPHRDDVFSRVHRHAGRSADTSQYSATNATSQQQYTTNIAITYTTVNRIMCQCML